MKILLLGGTGAIGAHLSNLLTQSNNDVYITTRRNRDSENNIIYIQGNAHDILFLENCLKTRWDVIIDFMVYSTDEFQNRFDLLLKATSQYIFLSSSRVYDDSKKPIEETSIRLIDSIDDQKYLNTDEYAISKARQENILTKSKFNNWTIIRPYITYSENRLQLGVLEKEAWLYRAMHGRTIVFSKDINEKLTTLTYGLNVSKGIESIIGRESCYGQVYNISNNTSITWKKILDIYLSAFQEVLGYKPKVMLCDLNSFMKFHSAEYQIKYDRLFNRQFDNSKIGKYINVEEFLKPKYGLNKCIVVFLKNPKFSYINWGAEAVKDRISNERTPLNEIQLFKHKIKYILYRYIIKF